MPSFADRLRAFGMRTFRRGRMRQFASLFVLADSTRVLDVGGTPFNWRLLAEETGRRPQVLMVNLGVPEWEEGHLRQEPGDATALPYPDQSFDLVYSNSVIEHVGGPEQAQAFAHHIRRLAPAYYVQTPNKWFPIEPHWMGPFIHWFPHRVQRHLFRWVTVIGWVNRPPLPNVDEALATTRLLDYREMRTLFPDAVILRERVLGLTKSLIAVRGAPALKTETAQGA